MKLAMVTLVVGVILGAGTQSALRPLSGEYVFVGRTPADPPPGEPTDSHMLFYLRGESARALWGKMDVAPAANACAEDEAAREKRIGNLACRELRGRFDCEFAIYVREPRLEWVTAC
jgi:hypothetical protein